MPRPTIPNIIFPKATSQLSKQNEQVSGGVCGGSWPHSFELVRPYGQTSNHSIYLDQLGTYDDPGKVPNPDFIARIEDAIERTWNDLDKFNDQEVIASDKYSKIRDILNRATLYASTATKLDDFWAEEYMPPNLKWINLDKEERAPGPISQSPDAHWALDDLMPWLGNCGSAYGDASAMVAKAGQSRSTKFRGPYGGTYEVSFNCPSKSDIEKHNSDLSIYKKLTEAAAQNARCAQELVYTIAFYALNKKESPQAPSRAEKDLIVQSKQVRADVVGGAVVEQEPDTPNEPKKDSKMAILALGAAAIAILASRK